MAVQHLSILSGQTVSSAFSLRSERGIMLGVWKSPRPRADARAVREVGGGQAFAIRAAAGIPANAPARAAEFALVDAQAILADKLGLRAHVVVEHH